MTISCFSPINNNHNEYVFNIYITLCFHHYFSESINFNLNNIEIEEIDFKENITEEEKKNSIRAFANKGLNYLNFRLNNTMLSDETDYIHNECYLKLDREEVYADDESEDGSCSD